MATISRNLNEKIFEIREFKGLNESPDGDTKLALGEAAVMRNFCITRDGNLKKRPGTVQLLKLGEGKINGLWSGLVNGKRELLAACDGRLYKAWDEEGWAYIREVLGEVSKTGRVHIFGFEGKAYIMDGEHYLCYDGAMLYRVEGYRPIVRISVPPLGGGESLEGVNRLCPLRRARLSPDGSARVFNLPEADIESIDYVKDLKTWESLPQTAYSYNLALGTLSFNEAPAQGANSIEVGWTAKADARESVEKMRYSELYNGSQDSRVFIYGDGSNTALYSGLDYDGRPRADYFPELNILSVGEENTPITGMIRHLSRLMVFKADSTWSIAQTALSLKDGTETVAFYVTPVNRSIGNIAAGQVQLVVNNPRTLFGADVYEWRNTSDYAASITSDERQARRISDRVFSTLGGFKLSDCLCFDDNYHQEYYICYEKRALIHNYARDAWYEYDGVYINALCFHDNLLLVGTERGEVRAFSDSALDDAGDAILAHWESGSMSFGENYSRKYSAQLWLGTKPQDSGELTVTVQTDRKSIYAEKVISSALSSFRRMNFASLSFRTNRKPVMARLKIKAKKFVFYKLIFENNASDKAATVLAADIKIRYTGSAK